MRCQRLFLSLVLVGMIALPARAQDVQADAGDAGDPEDGSEQVAPAGARTVITASDAPPAMGPSSQAIQVGNTIYCSGQIGIDPETDELVAGGTGTELRQAMNNLRTILREAGYTLEDIAYAQIFLTDMGEYETVNQVYGSYFYEPPPARSVVEVSDLPTGASVKIAATAVK